MVAARKSVRAPARTPASPLVRRRSPRSQVRAMARWLALIAVTQQVACGGKTTTAATPADPAPVASVTISPSSAQLSVGGNVQFVVTVQNTSNPAVTWEVNGIPGGNSTVGTITPAGAATASYLAPASVAAARDGYGLRRAASRRRDQWFSHGHRQPTILRTDQHLSAKRECR